jgi:hypothetical protein
MNDADWTIGAPVWLFEKLLRFINTPADSPVEPLACWQTQLCEKEQNVGQLPVLKDH